MTTETYDEARRFLDNGQPGAADYVLERWRANGLIRDGDWIIKSPGGFHPLTPEQFAATYEPADTPDGGDSGRRA